MPRLLAVLPLLIGLGLSGCAHVSAPNPPPDPIAWAHETSDLKPDPAVVWGRLENGLRYAILPHATPAQRASVTLLVQVGSYHERDHERGYAHFVEHLALRDLRDFPDESALRRLQTLGAGPHSNADTGLFETRYFFPDLPTDEPAALPTGLKILRAMADGVVFKPDSVERERGVIFSEWRSRDAMLSGARRDELEFLPPREASPEWQELSVLFEGSHLANHHTAGEDKSMRAATARRLREFYERWYRADRMILVVVGDCAPASVEPLIREAFATLAAPGRPPAVVPLDPPLNPIRMQAGGGEAETAMQVSLGVVRSHEDPDTVAARRRSLAGRLALAMLSRRLDRAVEAGGAPFFATEAFSSHYVPGRELVLLRARTRPADWSKATLALDLEVRRINELGFTPAEFALVARHEALGTEAAVRQAAHVHSAQMATELAGAIARGVVFTGAPDDHALTAAQLATLDEKECHAAFRALLSTGEWAMALRGPFDGDRSKTISIDFKESRTGPLTSYVPPAPSPPFPFTDFGPPGEIVRRERVAAIDTVVVQFANGVRLNLKHTRFEPGHAHIELRLGGGLAAAPPEQPGLAWRSFAWFLGGLRDLPPEDLRDIMAGKVDDTHYTVSATAFSFNSRLNAEELPLLFQLGAAFFARPAFRAEADARALELARQRIAPYTSTADGVASHALFHRISGGHAAYRPISLEETSRRTLVELKAWIVPLLATAPLEIGVIGDFDAALVIEACARTFGALPSRAVAAATVEKRGAAARPAPFSETITFAGTKGVAVVALAWPVPEATAVSAQFRLRLLSEILEERITRKLRAEMGETYSPSVSVEGADAISPAGPVLRCSVEADPARVGRVAAAAREVVAVLAREGATVEEFERARGPQVRQTESGLRNNAWWLDLVVAAQSNPAYGEGWARAVEEYQAATLSEINALARSVLAADRLCQLVVQSK